MGQAVDAQDTPPVRAARPTGPVPGFRHGAALVGSDVELLATALPFLDEGLRAGDLVTMTCPPEVTGLLREALGDRSGGVVADRALSLLGARAPDALGRAGEYVADAADRGSGRLRVLSVVDFGDRPAGWREGRRFEAAANRFMAGSSVSCVCIYDRRRLPAEVVAGAAATHPELVRSGEWSASAAFAEPERVIRALSAVPHPLEAGAPVFAVDDAPTLAWLRHRLGEALAGAVPDADQREDLHLAVSEVAANAFRHGARPVSARVWTDGADLVCCIGDAGTSFGDPMAGFRPAHGEDLGRGGMGLWLARKLFDAVDLLPAPSGLTVRLAARLR